MDTQQQQQLRGAGAQNMFGALGDLSGGLIQAGSLFGKPKASYGEGNYIGE
jgi:hypothetical protein